MKPPRNKKQALARIKVAAKIKDATIGTFEEFIVQARESGCTLREIEKVAGITNPGVMYLVRRVRKKKKMEV